MNDNASKKIIVIGGSGETGKRIVYHLSKTYPTVIISSAARRQQDDLLVAQNVNAIGFDIDDGINTIPLLKKYDLAIIALGPMDKYRATVHKLCLRANIDAIDINDNLDAADDILALNEIAKQKGLSFFTGMGFSPGLSTLLLMQLSQQNNSSEDHYHCRLYMGAAYGGGETSPYAMLASFNNHITCLYNGKRLIRDTPWKDNHSQFLFPGQSKKLDLIPYATPEISGLTSSRSISSSINTLDSRYHIQFLSQGLAKFLAKFKLKKGAIEFFAKKFYSSGQSIKNKKNADPDTCLWVYPDKKPDEGLMIHGVVSSYDLTALMACTITDCWLNNSLQQYQGVYGIEHLLPETHQDLVLALAKRGVTSRKSNAETIINANIHFGWVSPEAIDVVKLRNFGKTWYTFEKPHPKMEDLQKQFLFESDIWKALKQALNGIGFTKFIFKTLLRWKSHNKRLNAYRTDRSELLVEKWTTITKDMSMFTSGYSCAREVLGQEEALKLYQRMFLETGKMEMRWLWPAPETFAAFSSPEAAIKQYWLEFINSYQALGIFKASISKPTENKVICVISECAYAKMFTELGCPELSDMVREMEKEALLYICSKSSLSIDWETHGKGSATIVLDNTKAFDHIDLSNTTACNVEPILSH